MMAKATSAIEAPLVAQSAPADAPARARFACLSADNRRCSARFLRSSPTNFAWCSESGTGATGTAGGRFTVVLVAEAYDLRSRAGVLGEGDGRAPARVEFPQ